MHTEEYILSTLQAALADMQRERDARDSRIAELVKRMVHMESDLEEAVRRESLLKQVHTKRCIILAPNQVTFCIFPFWFPYIASRICSSHVSTY
jgi:hypothetical protein